MKYIKTFEKQIYFKVGDIVKIVKKIKAKPDWKKKLQNGGILKKTQKNIIYNYEIYKKI